MTNTSGVVKLIAGLSVYSLFYFSCYHLMSKETALLLGLPLLLLILVLAGVLIFCLRVVLQFGIELFKEKGLSKQKNGQGEPQTVRLAFADSKGLRLRL